MDPGVVVATEGHDRARDIGPHLDDNHRIDRPSGSDRDDDVALCRRCRHVTRWHGAVHYPIDERAADHDGPRNHKPDQFPIHAPGHDATPKRRKQFSTSTETVLDNAFYRSSLEALSASLS